MTHPKTDIKKIEPITERQQIYMLWPLYCLFYIWLAIGWMVVHIIELPESIFHSLSPTKTKKRNGK